LKFLKNNISYGTCIIRIAFCVSVNKQFMIKFEKNINFVDRFVNLMKDARCINFQTFVFIEIF